MKRILDANPEAKIMQYMHIDVDGKAVIESIQDATDMLEFNQRAAELLDKGKDMWFIGRIPLVKCQEWAQEAGVKVFSKEWMLIARRKVQERDNRKLNPNNIRL